MENSLLLFGLTEFVCIIILLIVVSVQVRINNVNKKYYPDAPKNGWTVANIVWVVIGVLYYVFIFLLTILGQFLEAAK
jgi:cytochrome b561